MQQPTQGVEERLLGLALNVPPARLVSELREFARELLAAGYPRQRLYDDFESVRAALRERGDAYEEREDAVMDVMDFLSGWCAPGAKL